jgi:methyl-accepting chemotaxis protein
VRDILSAIQEETNATILATEQGTRQTHEVGELMDSTRSMLDESLVATQQQRSAADQVAAAMVQIRQSAQQLAAEQEQRSATAGAVDELVENLTETLSAFGVELDQTHGRNGGRSENGSRARIGA